MLLIYVFVNLFAFVLGKDVPREFPLGEEVQV